MNVVVWIDAWQMQCCGTPFSVNDEVHWTLGDGKDDEWIESVADETAQSIEFREEHHGGLPDDAPITKGIVRSIRTLHTRYVALEGQQNELVPVSGSGTFAPKTYADGWEAEDFETGAAERYQFDGYVVELELLEG